VSPIQPKKSLGQHFLVDDNILDVIGRLAELDPADVVLEVVNGIAFFTPLWWWLGSPRVTLVHHVHQDHYVAEMGRVLRPGGWAALLPVYAVASADLSASAVARVRAALARETSVHAVLLDLQGEANRLYSGYLSEAVQLAITGFCAIVLLLSVALRSFARVTRVVAPLALSVLAVAGLLVALGERLTILHVVGMLLIVAVGSNYALFFDRSAQPSQGSVPLTLASLLIANIATVLTFSVLACSRVTVLADLGSTVAPGTLLALLFSALLARPPPAPPAAAPTGAS